MKIALDPYMHRHLPLTELPRLTRELGYDHIELSPRADFLEWWVRPRLFPARLQAFKKALREQGVTLASIQPMYRWSSPFQDEWETAIRNWKIAIQVAVEMDCDTLVSEFGRGGSPARSHACQDGRHNVEACEDAYWRTMDVLVPILEKEGVTLSVEPHPEDWIETLTPAVDIVRTINSERVKCSYIAPHTFYYGDDMAELIRYAAPVLAHVRIADTFNHKASSQLRYIVNPPGSTARVHQHLNMGEGEIDWDLFFGTLSEVGFDGVLSSCVFAWEEKAEASSRFMRQEMQRYLDKYFK
jgi:myo-inositol catabolism protein IolH